MYCCYIIVEVLRIQKVSSDGLELMVSYIWKLTIAVQPIFLVHFYIFIEKEASYGSAWHSEHILLNFIGSAIMSFEYTIVWMVAASVIAFVVTYFNVISKLLATLNW